MLDGGQQATLTVREVAALTGFSVDTIRASIRSGKIKTAPMTERYAHLSSDVRRDAVMALEAR